MYYNNNNNKDNIELESKIIQLLQRDNTRGNTIHFKWDRVPETPSDFILEVITHNPINGQNFLMKRIFADTNYKCLTDMIDYLDNLYKTEPVWSVLWTDVNGVTNQSYFRGESIKEVEDKFFYEYDTKLNSKILSATPIKK